MPSEEITIEVLGYNSNDGESSRPTPIYFLERTGGFWGVRYVFIKKIVYRERRRASRITKCFGAKKKKGD